MNLINNSFLKKYFIGFIEPYKLFSGSCDIMITDGFTGNIILKTAEGLSNYIMENLKFTSRSGLRNEKITSKRFLFRLWIWFNFICRSGLYMVRFLLCMVVGRFSCRPFVLKLIPCFRLQLQSIRSITKSILNL